MHYMHAGFYFECERGGLLRLPCGYLFVAGCNFLHPVRPRPVLDLRLYSVLSLCNRLL